MGNKKYCVRGKIEKENLEKVIPQIDAFLCQFKTNAYVKIVMSKRDKREFQLYNDGKIPNLSPEYGQFKRLKISSSDRDSIQSLYILNKPYLSKDSSLI